MNKETFRISSALKNLVGQELITDEFVAVFELVKNSFDANARKVQIKFDNQLSDARKLIIIDDGKGMDYAELRDKWLFLAYSAKKDGTELDDYRNKIKVNRVFAGAKGIGRFSCDRLGASLSLITKKDENNTKVENLIVNWKDFEQDSKEEFINIPVLHQELKSFPSSFKHGTLLEISRLRDYWDRQKILKLKKSLVKLINPNQGNDSQNFSIEIIAEHELKADRLEEEHEDFKIVNGQIENKLFETLDIRTTNIHIEIAADGKIVTSTLRDRGSLIYKIQEKNPYPSLENISIYLFQLNRSSKISFHRLMGMASVNYGSVFMYKNGFRIYPFGERGIDLLGIDRRKAQGYSRFLGTRDLIGRIEINGENPQLRETTSRDGGLLKTDTYLDLIEFFKNFALVRLEKYVVQVIEWGDPKIDKTTKIKVRDALNPADVKIQILELITSLASSPNVINIVDYEDDFLDIIESKQDKSITKILKNVSRIAKKTDDAQLLGEIKKIDRTIKNLQQDTEAAIIKASKEEQKSKHLADELESQIKDNLFVRSAINPTTKQILSLQHHIGHSSKWISGYLNRLIDAVKDGASEKKLLNLISKIDIKNKEVLTISQFITKAKFNTITDKITDDIIAFVNQYLENVYKLYDFRKLNGAGLDIRVENIPDESFVMKFRPIQLIIIIDNLITNSETADASELIFHWNQVGANALNLHVRDNGDGIEDSIIDKIFDFRFTTTEGGSGLGLYHVADLVKNLKGNIQVNNKLSNGVEFILTFQR